MKYYRGRFMIGIYATISEGETLLALCDNITEFAKYLETSKYSASMILSKAFNGKIKHIKLKGKLRILEFIEL